MDTDKAKNRGIRGRKPTRQRRRKNGNGNRSPLYRPQKETIFSKKTTICRIAVQITRKALLPKPGNECPGCAPGANRIIRHPDLEVRVTASIVVGVIRQGSSAEDFRSVDWTNRLPYTKRSVDLMLPVFFKLFTERRVTDDRRHSPRRVPVKR